MALLGTHADFSQTDPRWSGRLLGYSTWEKLGPYGCFVTAMANVAQAQGQDFDPNTMNNALKKDQQFVKDYYGQLADVAGYGALTHVAPHSRFVAQKFSPGLQAMPASFLDVRNTTNAEVIVMLDYHPAQAGLQPHFCRVIGLNPAKTDVEIVDSYTGKRIWISSIMGGAHETPFQVIESAGKYIKV